MGAERYARILNTWVHDLASGLWPAALLVMYILSGRGRSLPVEALGALADARSTMFALMVGSLAAIVVTGVLRARYWRGQATPEELPARRKAMIVKHVGYLLVYTVGTVWAWTLL